MYLVQVLVSPQLAALEIPLGLNKEQFHSFVSAQLLQKPIIMKVDQFVETLDRFGTVSN